MGDRPRAYAVNQAVGTVSDGITVRLLAVEVWPNRVVVSLGVLADEKSNSLLAAYDAQLADWSVEARGRPPHDPARVLVDELDIALNDAAGTAFTFGGSSAGGSGTEWAATRIFTPSATGAWLALSITGRSGRRDVRLELDG
jgi:hypothetical protein